MKRSRLGKTTKLTSEKLRKKCVVLAKWIARAQQNFTCEYCGRREPTIKTHGSHIYSEGVYKSMSADVDNILCLCYTHHIGGWMQTKEPSWHKNPVEMVEWFNEYYPERSKKLKERSRLSVQADEFFWKNRLAILKAQVAKMKVDNPDLQHFGNYLK